jgi:AcrR family transcriptional regulator
MTARARTAVRRQAILDAALHLFATRGLRATSVEDICNASGASNGSLYHHFGSKEGIAATLYVSAIDDYQRGALAVFRDSQSAEAGFCGCVEHYLQWVLDHREFAVLMLAVEHTDVRELAANQVAALNETFLRGIGEWMSGRAAAGELPDVAADLMMPAVLGPARRFAELWLEGKTHTPMTEAARVLADVAWRGLGYSSPASQVSEGRRVFPPLPDIGVDSSPAVLRREEPGHDAGQVSQR